MMNADIITKSAPPKLDINNVKFFDSEEDELKFENTKKNLFCSENSHKIDKNRNSEAKSTEPTSIRVKNYYIYFLLLFFILLEVLILIEV